MRFLNFETGDCLAFPERLPRGHNAPCSGRHTHNPIDHAQCREPAGEQAEEYKDDERLGAFRKAAQVIDRLRAPDIRGHIVLGRKAASSMALLSLSLAHHWPVAVSRSAALR